MDPIPDSRPTHSDIPEELLDDTLASSSFATMAKKNACAFAVGWLAGTSGINPFVFLGF